MKRETRVDSVWGSEDALCTLYGGIQRGRREILLLPLSKHRIIYGIHNI